MSPGEKKIKDKTPKGKENSKNNKVDPSELLIDERHRLSNQASQTLKEMWDKITGLF